MARILNLTGKKELIFRGDVVSFDGVLCLVGIHPESHKTVLTALETGDIVTEYGSSMEVDIDDRVTLICQKENVSITLNK
ncbi:TPA: hypothetical protein KOX39_003452 [Clostridioides difficile]|nr:hypothetical protein [Clostridioides difficile]